jgi:rhamnosyl/mannosyltransferase
MAKAQARQGMEVHVVCINHADHLGHDITWSRHGNTPTVCEYDGAVRVTRLGRSASLGRLDICPRLPRLLRMLDRQGIDVLHLHTPNPMMLLGVAMAGIQTPLVITHHSDIVRQRILKLALRPFEQNVYSHAAAIVTNSPSYSAQSPLLQRYAARVHTLPMGIDLRPYMNASPAVLHRTAAIKAEYGQPLWLSVGRCVYYKHYHVAIAALAHVPGKLMIVGYGPMRGQLQQQAQHLGVADRIIWRDYLSREELIGTYRAATALWFPSGARSEAFGLVQVEAMASGCPVLNADIASSGVPWVSRHEQSGLTTPVGDARALAAAARRLLEEPNLRAALSAGAVKRATEDFDHLVMADRSRAVYAKVLESERIIRLPREQQAAARPWQYTRAAPSLQPVGQKDRPILDADEDEGAELAI